MNLKEQLSAVFSLENLTPTAHSIYLASSYSADCPAERSRRVIDVIKLAAAIRDAGYCCYSPIIHWHHVELLFPAMYDVYLKHDLIQLSHHDILIVLCNNDWEKSFGITKEIIHASINGIPIYYISTEGEIANDPRKFQH